MFSNIQKVIFALKYLHNTQKMITFALSKNNRL